MNRRRYWNGEGGVTADDLKRLEDLRKRGRKENGVVGCKESEELLEKWAVDDGGEHIAVAGGRLPSNVEY